MLDAVRKFGRWIGSARLRRDRIPADFEEQIPLGAITKVTFFKIDEITTDLICCEVEADGRVWFFHEEAEGWDALVRYLEKLPGFRQDWYGAVFLPPFARSDTLAYRRGA